MSDVVLDALAPVTLIVGANNAGKTSVLEAAGLVLRPPDPAQWVNAVRDRDVDMPLIDGLWSLFPHGGTVHTEDGPQTSPAMLLEGSTSGRPRTVDARCIVSQNRFAGSGSSAVTWVSGSGSSAVTRIGTSGPSGLVWVDGGPPVVLQEDLADFSVRIEVSVDGDPPLTLKFPAPGGVAHSRPTYRVFSVTPATHYSTRALVEHLSHVVDEGNKQLAVELLRVFDPKVEDLDVVAPFGRQAVRVTHAVRGVVDLSSFGDGMRRSAALALALTRASQGVLLVDELEAGVHPSVLRSVLSKVLEAATTAQVQLIATTHSLEAVDAVLGSVEERGTPEMLAAFWLQRSNARHEVRRYDFDKLAALREGGLDIR
jgi:energy-coupling factor transporter ATP-binding protein EcfA2